MWKVLDTVKELALYSLFPNKCVFCDSIIGVSGSVCKECENTLPYVLDSICPKCGKDDCVCLEEKYSFDEVVVPFYYDKEVCNSVHRFKFDNCSYYAKTYADYIAKKLLQSKNARNVDYITYVPLSKKDFKKRGYNQAEKIAEQLEKLTDIECKQIIIKTKETKKQHNLNSKERRKNLKNVFEVVDDFDLKGKTIILCDDIMTTGSTLNEIAKLLKSKGVNAVICGIICSTYCRNGLFMAKYRSMNTK